MHPAQMPDASTRPWAVAPRIETVRLAARQRQPHKLSHEGLVAHVLVVEDEPAIQELIVVNLLRAGHQVRRAADVREAQREVDAELPDVVLVDWMLPTQPGIDLVRRLRSSSRTRGLGIIMLSARTSEHDKIAALEAGADDYVTKPFSPRELLARIAAVLRRRAPQPADDALEINGLRLDPVARSVTCGGVALPVGSIEFRLLHLLMTHPDRVYRRTELLDEVWGDSAIVDERTVDSRMRVLRGALAGSGHEGLIETVRGIGYRLNISAS